MNSGIMPNLSRSSGSTWANSSPGSCSDLERTVPWKPTPLWPMRCSMICSSPANAPPQMNRMLVVSIWMNSWCGCLRPPCGGTEADRALEDLQQRLLHAFAADVAGDRRVLALAGDLVDLVDVDDAGLGLLHVEVGGLDQLEEDVLDVLADVAGLGERGGVGDGERHVEQAGQRLGEVRLAAAGGAEQQDVALRQLDLVAPADAPRSAGTGCAGSGCRRRPTGSSWPRPGRRRSRRGTCGSRRGVGSSSKCSSLVSVSSSSMISLHRSMHSSQMYTPGPAMSFLTCFCDLAAEAHFSSSPVSPNFATCVFPCSVAGDQRIGPVRSTASRDEITSSMMPYSMASFASITKSRSVSVWIRSIGLAGVQGEDLLEQVAHPQDLLGGELEVGDLAVADLAVRLVQQDPAVRQRQALALGAGGEQHGGGRRGLARGRSWRCRS